MQISVTGDCGGNVRRSGFSLIEVLVALVILAVIAGVLILSTANSGAEPRMRLEIERLQARLNLACERAELTGRDIGLHFGTGMYGFSQRQGDLMKMQTAPPLAPYTLPKDMQLILEEIELTKGLPEKPQMLCFSSGERTPLMIALQASNRDPRFRLSIEATGTGRIQRRLADRNDWQDWNKGP